MLEIILSLSVLSIALGGICPVLHKVYVERLTIKQERKALELLSNKIRRGSGTGFWQDEVTSSGTTNYYWEREIGAGGRTGICIVFTGKNGREYKECEVIKQ